MKYNRYTDYKLDEDLPEKEKEEELSIESIDEAVSEELKQSGIYSEELDSNIEISEDDKEFLADLRYFCSEYIREFTDEFWKRLESYELSPGHKVDEKIKIFLRDKKLDLPVFVVRNGTKSANFLDENHLSYSLGDSHFLLEFRIPKQLGYFWWKDKKDQKNIDEEKNDKRKSIGNAGIAWGDIYRDITPIMWNKIINQFGDGKINFDRVNPPKVHNSKGYYYLFDVSCAL